MATIQIPQTFLRMGVRRHQVTLAAAEFNPDPDVLTGSEYGMLLLWKREYPWLSVSVRTGNHTWGDGSPGTLSFQKVCATVQANPSELAPKNPSHSRAALVRRGEAIHLTFTIQTNHRELRNRVRERRANLPAGSDLQIPMNLIAFDFRKDRHTIPWKLSLHLTPLTSLPPFGGYVALDLGNFSSGIASLRSGKITSGDILMLDAEAEKPMLSSDGKSVDSLVRFDGLTTWYASEHDSKQAPARIFPDVRYPQDDLPTPVTWVAGQAARDGSLAQQLAGAKRLLARPDADGTQTIPLEHIRVFLAEKDSLRIQETVQVKHRVPAELLATTLLQRFVQAVRFNDNQPAGWPRYLAVTYPTSYAPAEIHALRTALHRAWLRTMSEHQSPQTAIDETDDEISDGEKARRRIVSGLQKRLDPDRRMALGDVVEQEDDLIRLMLDEATAASFYYLFRFAAESPGGLTAFRYKYPEGMNLLLYDCGGGTTDIALVQARVALGDSNQITLRVLGRSGVRHFGGDDITIAVCRLLKAKIAALGIKERFEKTIPPIKLTPLDPNEPAKRLTANGIEVLRFLNAVAEADPNDSFVPTQFDPTDTSPATADARERAMTLWTWGEQLKYKIGATHKSVSLGMLEGVFQASNGLLHKAILEAGAGPKAAAPVVKDYGERILKIEIHRDEIDALIARQVVRTLACCRSLVQQKLPGDRDLVAPVVHKVAVTGNASRYPLIREMLLERLQVSDLEPVHWFHYEEKELKSAVAKGAVQALAAMSGVGVNRFRFDTKMAECLPFDVAYRDFRRRDFPQLYRQQDPYSTLVEKTVPMATLRDEETSLLRQFTLFRRFPGDGDRLDRDDESLPAFEHADEMTRLAQQDGYSEFLTWDFADPISGNLTVFYDPATHTFRVRDAQGAEGRLVTGDVEDIRSRAPHQRGTL